MNCGDYAPLHNIFTDFVFDRMQKEADVVYFKMTIGSKPDDGFSWSVWLVIQKIFTHNNDSFILNESQYPAGQTAREIKLSKDQTGE
jgi:hypothetical protein